MEKCIIIGAGPAGTTAAIYLARFNILPIVIYKDGGSLIKAKKIENLYGFPDTISGEKLFENGIKQAQKFGVKFIKDEVVSVTYDGNYIVNTVNNSYHTKTVLLATGNSRKTSKIKGADAFEGKGVSYCAVCDGFFYREKIVSVIGNTNYALHEANYLAETSKKVYILTDGLEVEFEDSKSNIEVIKDKILSINGNEKVENIEFDNGNSLDTDGVFIALGTCSSSDIARQVGAIVDENQNIKVDENFMTSTPGIFSAGDSIGGLLQINKASTDGTNSAFSIKNYLKTV